MSNVSNTALWELNQSYCFLGGVVLCHDVQDPTDDELQEEMGKMGKTRLTDEQDRRFGNIGTKQMNHIFKV